jgi:putative membrane protein
MIPTSNKVALLTLLLWPASLAAQDSSKFLTTAIQGNLAEVSMGQLAQKNASSKEVRDYGEMLVKDHTAANEKAEAAAKEAGVKPPSAPNAQQKSDMKSLTKLSGSKFDREFMQHMVKDHTKAITLYKQEASSGTGPVAAYAKESLPVLQEHRQKAEKITQNLK